MNTAFEILVLEDSISEAIVEKYQQPQAVRVVRGNTISLNGRFDDNIFFGVYQQ